MPDPYWYGALKRLLENAVDIVVDLALTVILLLGLRVVSDVVIRSGASDEFKLYFTRVHEWTTLTTFAGVGITTTLRIILRR